MKSQLVGTIQRPGQKPQNVDIVVDKRPNITRSERAAGIEWVNGDYEPGDVRRYGAVGDGVTDDATAVGAWLDVAKITGWGYAPDGTYLLNSTVSKSFGVDIYLTGNNAIFKSGGSNRLGLLLFTGCTGKFHMDGITIDGNDISARPFEVYNLSATSSTLGQVYIGESCRFINAKNNTPDTSTTAGVWIEGGFSSVVFEGEVDGVDDTRTTGAECSGVTLNWDSGGSDDWIRHGVITGKSRIRNVKNSNTVTADADGLGMFAPTDKHATLVVQPGALFEECEGRAIKSQVVSNAIDSPIIRRSAYDGLDEIDLQYSGGHVIGAKVYHDGTRCNHVIRATSRLNLPSHCTISANELTVEGTPSSDTGNMVFLWGTDTTDAVKRQGAVIRDNKVIGSIDNFMTIYSANVIDTNRVIIDSNWCETVNGVFIETEVVFNNTAQLTVVFTNNGCQNSCTGSDITGQLIVEYERGNHGITPLLSAPHLLTIATGAITVYGATHRVATEGAAATDDLDTITGTNRSHDEWLTLLAADDGDTVVCKDGTGNLALNGDFSLTHSDDRIVLSFDGTNWVEICRSDNTA